MEKLSNEQSQETVDVNPTAEGKSVVIMTSDPQFPWSPALDEGASEDEFVTMQISRDLITAQYHNINNYIETRPTGSADVIGLPVFINGDITAFGHSWQRANMEDFLKIISNTHNCPLYLGLGNHDYENNVDDSYQNVAAVGMMNWYRSYASSFRNIISTDVYWEEWPYKYKFTQSFGYSVDLGNAVVIQVHNYPTYSTYFYGWNSADNPVNTYEYNIFGSLTWIEDQLKWARDRGKIIFINTHYPYGWAGGPSEKFKTLLFKYNVTAVFAGHFHSSAGVSYHTDYYGSVPVFLSGGASQSTYLIVEYTTSQVDVFLVTDNNHANKKLLKSVMVFEQNLDPLVIAGEPIVISNLYKNRMIDLNESTNEKIPQFFSWTGGANQDFILSYNKEKDLYQINSLKYPNKALAILPSGVRLVPNYEASSWLRITYSLRYYTPVDGRVVEFTRVYFISTADSSLYMTYDPGYSDGRETLEVSAEPIPFKLIFDTINAPSTGPDYILGLDPLGFDGQTVILSSLYGKEMVDLNDSVSDKTPQMYPWNGDTNQQFRAKYNDQLRVYQLFSIRFPDKALAINKTNNDVYLASVADASDDTYFYINHLESYEVEIDGVNRRFSDVYTISNIENKYLNYDMDHSDSDAAMWTDSYSPYRLHTDLNTAPQQGGTILS